ncbi:short chain dehydrogenase [Nonomuraea africana]|uniref:NAD(P)-dependent dehydrogenase (Short-subunit alcohol dehydrogenase family) n=1 Tax=Nonomuraea africana TaxID=46171 RepID=A0ABR9KIU6_9ACTN|nr:short chain dehydrogenase [Nonomuraea africana]MBE1561895.1 NAD(P)-dependent dehydrogenase (short-subunit alcohol dehydrogenase family) [Nonomuraea africana]
MRILLVGATGTLGQAVHEVLRERGHEIVTASRKGSDVTVDITDPESIRAMYEQVGEVDAVASAAGSVPWPAFDRLGHQDVLDGIAGKVISQVELVRQGAAAHVRGSFTLISGVLARDPVRTGVVASLANGAIEAFVRAAAIELPQRVNAVSPTVFTESIDAYGELFAGFEPVPVRQAANAYVRSIEGHQTGQVYEVG